jgi:cell division septum initiation protein DivIVA
MTTEQQIEKIYQRVQQLLKERDELLTKNGQLQRQLDAAKQQHEQSGHTITRLQQQTQALQLLATGADPATKQEMEKTINRYLKEIDKAITLLSE